MEPIILLEGEKLINLRIKTYLFPNCIGLLLAHFSHSNYSRIKNLDEHYSGQISSRPHRISPQKVAEVGKSPYFGKILVGEIL